MKIAIAGTGYVGLSLAVLFARCYEVCAIDILPEKVEKINKRKSPIHDEMIESFFEKESLNLKATLSYEEACSDAEYVIIATPTDYDSEKNYFNTTSVEDALEKVLKINKKATIIIKSTVPVGFTQKMREKLKTNRVIFSPEFLREGKALYDNLHPSRIVVGDESDEAKKFAMLLLECSYIETAPIVYTNSTEAEAIKLFANTYLAMRIAFFNELDSYAEIRGLDTKAVINGIGYDPRVGSHYNNPSFGYGGYCLPKDTKQLLANYTDIPQCMMSAIVESNRTRKDHITDMIIKKNPKVVGIYRLTMKSGSDNFRSSAIQGIMKRLIERGVKVIVFEPELDEDVFYNCKVIKTFNDFAEESDIIVANRMSAKLSPVRGKVYTRDIFGVD